MRRIRNKSRRMKRNYWKLREQGYTHNEAFKKTGRRYKKRGNRRSKKNNDDEGRKDGKGVPKGFRHIWGYHGKWDEKKIRPGKWKFKFTATKGKRSKSYGSFGKGTTGAWDIEGKQYIKKVGKGKYQTILYGTKKPLKFHVKKPKNKKKRNN